MHVSWLQGEGATAGVQVAADRGLLLNRQADRQRPLLHPAPGHKHQDAYAPFHHLPYSSCALSVSLADKKYAGTALHCCVATLIRCRALTACWLSFLPTVKVIDKSKIAVDPREKEALRTEIAIL